MIHLRDHEHLENALDSKPNVLKKLSSVLSIIKSVVIIIVLSVPVFIKCFLDVFIAEKKKCVRGWTALITGGGNGLGKLMAGELAKEGCNIAILDIDGAAAQETAKELRNHNVKAFGYQADVTDTKAVENIKDRIELDIGPVDILINNAGLLRTVPTLEETNEDIKRAVSINFTSYISNARIFIPGMIKRKKGHIVTMSSLAGHHAMGIGLLYSSTKFGVASFALSLDEEIRQAGLAESISSSVIYPFFAATRKDLTDSIKVRIPMIDPKYVAKAAVKGILKNAREIYIYDMFKSVVKLNRISPYEVNMLIRKYVFREKEMYDNTLLAYRQRCELQNEIRNNNEEKVVNI